LIVLLMLPVAFSQAGMPEDAKLILQQSEADQRHFVDSYLDAGFPENEGDRFSFLLVNRSSLVLPILELKIEQELKQEGHAERLIELGSAMISYAGNVESLRAISNLMRIDETRFGRLVGRTLDNAGNWRNPFSVVYRGLEIGDEAVSRRIAAWVESALASNTMQRTWAEAMLDRYGTVPGDSEWATDPIVSQLKARASREVRQRILRLAAEVQKGRERR
jgi:hypothetical protein